MKIILYLSFCSLIFCACTPSYNTDIFKNDVIIDYMQRVCDYQLSNPTPHHSKNRNFTNGWVPASFYTGVMATYKVTGNVKYLNAAIAWSESNNWQPAPRLRHADDVACGQTYLELYLHQNDPKMITPIKARFDSLIADPKPGREDWSWCDALFMAPPVLARLATATGDTSYLTYMNSMYWDTYEYLFDTQERLFYRDDRYFEKRTKNDKKVFWSRGNGWVMAGIIRILEYLPADDLYRTRYIKLLQEMATKVITLQGKYGLWRTSLLDFDEYPKPEASGSGFFCYALAAGINKGYLNRDKYIIFVQRAWWGLTSTVHDNGKIGWVQRIGHNPDDVTYEDTHAYGAGAFLLAGSEVIQLRLD